MLQYSCYCTVLVLYILVQVMNAQHQRYQRHYAEIHILIVSPISEAIDTWRNFAMVQCSSYCKFLLLYSLVKVMNALHQRYQRHQAEFLTAIVSALSEAIDTQPNFAMIQCSCYCTVFVLYILLQVMNAQHQCYQSH